MLKEAIEKIEAMAAKPEVKVIDGHNYIIDKDGAYTEIKPDINVPESIRLHSLDAVVKMVRTEAIGAPQVREDLAHINGRLIPIYIEVLAHDKVKVFLQPMGEDQQCYRPELYEVVAQDIPGWEPETRLAFDQAAVALQTRFEKGGDLDYTLALLSQITTGAKVTYADNGIATSIVTQKGVALQQNQTIKPVVKLRPYRTFQEVEQPEGLFLIRINERGITFTEADGGMWKLTARKTVAAYLSEALAEEIEAGDVVVML